jgi:GTP-binding protein
VLVQRSRGRPGEVSHLELELKLIGDVGLLGLPNAGKSSTLAALSRARPKVAPYPFTTIHPIVGMVEFEDGYRVQLADIPGLIEGASDGKGMGIDFLRHVQRTHALLYVLDASSPLSSSTVRSDPVNDLRALVGEITRYDPSLLSRPAIIAANKIDLLLEHDRMGDEVEERTQLLSELLGRLEDEARALGIYCEGRVLGTSAGATGQGLPELASAIRTVVEANKVRPRGRHTAYASDLDPRIELD